MASVDVGRNPRPVDVPGRGIATVRANSPTTDDPDGLEDLARAGVETAAARVRAAAAAAFPDRTDPFEVYTQAVVAAGVQQARSSLLLNRANAERVRRMLADFAAELDSFDRPHVSEDGSAHHRVHDEEEVEVRADILPGPRPSWWRFALMASPVVLILTGAGVEHWRTARSDTAAASAAMTTINALAFSAQSELTTGAAALHSAIADVKPGLTVLTQIAALPEPERAALTGLLTELQTNPGSISVAQVRDFFTLPVPTRNQALAFAQTGTPLLRDEVLSVQRAASARKVNAAYTNHQICVVPGPSYKVADRMVRTCLVQVPEEWSESDQLLKKFYQPGSR